MFNFYNFSSIYIAIVIITVIYNVIIKFFQQKYFLNTGFPKKRFFNTFKILYLHHIV